MIQRFLEAEASLFSGIKERIEKNYSGETDIPKGLILVEIAQEPVYKIPVAVLREGQKLKGEEWSFKRAFRVEDVNGELSDSTKEEIQNLALKLEVDPNTVFAAALLTRTLIDNPGKETAVDIDGGPEVLRLVRATLPEGKFNGGLILPTREGYSLEYYFCPGAIEIGNRVEPVRYLIAHTTHKAATFEEIFPPVLLFSAVVAQKHQPEEIEAEVEKSI